MLSYSLSELKKLEGQEIHHSRSEAGNWLQPRLENIEHGKAELSVLIRKEMCNPFGNIHGGMMALVVDEAIGWAVVSLEAESHYTSITLNLDFLYAASEGERIKAQAAIVRQGKKVIYAEVAVFNENNTLLCRAGSNLVVTGMKPVG
jgi:uncharacterized protein (TIGR00369 family)